MAKPKFLYDQRFNDATPVASSTAAGDFNVLNLRDWRPYTWWKPSAMPATVRVDSGVPRKADYALLNGVFDAVQIVGSNNNWATEELVASSNLLLQSEHFGATWVVLGGGSLTLDTGLAPDGALTADRLNGSNAYLRHPVTLTPGVRYVFSGAARPLGADAVVAFGALKVGDSGNFTSTKACTAGLWTRFSHTWIENGLTTGVYLLNNSGAPNVEYWGATLKAGSALPGAYQKVPSTLSKQLLLPFAAPNALFLPGISGASASTPDSAAISLTSQILGVRLRVGLDDWTPVQERYFLNKGGELSWICGVNPGGNLFLYASGNGTTWNLAGPVASTVATAFADGSVQWIGYERDPAAGTVKFFTSTDGVTFTQLGANVASTVGNLFDSAGALGVWGWDQLGAGRAYYAELRSGGINGTVVASFNAADATAGATSFVSILTGETWTINGSAKIEASPYRYWGIRCTDAAAPSLAIAAIGEALEAPVYFDGQFDPTSRRVHGQTNRNENGHPLGRAVYFEGWEASIRLPNVSWSWARDSFLPAWKSHLRGSPFGFVWESDKYPEDVRLVQAGDQVRTPHRAGELGDVEIEVEGVAP